MLLLLAACTVIEPDLGDAVETPSFGRWQYPDTWEFHVVDDQQRSLGSITLRLTEEDVGDDLCADAFWKRAVVLEDRLEIDLGGEKHPAYHIEGPWLTLDLTAANCRVSHNFIGEISSERASGFFTQSHPLGGQNLGSFTGTPVMAQDGLPQ